MSEAHLNMLRLPIGAVAGRFKTRISTLRLVTRVEQPATPAATALTASGS